jgi:hypothetical protein
MTQYRHYFSPLVSGFSNVPWTCFFLLAEFCLGLRLAQCQFRNPETDRRWRISIEMVNAFEKNLSCAQSTFL